MERKVGLYVHVPFCATKCPYCDFYSEKYHRATENAYVDAVITHMKRYAEQGLQADTLYFGGGTPSLLSSENVQRILDVAREVFLLQGEVTIEANPNSVNKQKLMAYREAGINRISFGMQSGVLKELEALGRKHTIEQVISAVQQAKAVGIANISVDIMLGTPYQTQESIEETISLLKHLPVTHVSAYMLKIEENTPYAQSPLQKECVDEDMLADIYLKTVAMLEQNGLMQYEISNFAKPGLESQHNLKYWRREEYLGFGPSAHSYFDKQRFFFPSSVENYIDTNGENKKIEEVLYTQESELEEHILLGLRLKEGINPTEIAKMFQLSSGILEKACVRYEKAGFMQASGQKYFLTPSGFLVSNMIILDLIETMGFKNP